MRPSLTRFLTSADSPYEGPLLNCVELMAGGRGAAGRDGKGRDGTDGRPGWQASQRGGRGPGAPPPPLIGARRTCPYKAARRRIPAVAGFLSPSTAGPPPRRSTPSPAARRAPPPLNPRETEARRDRGPAPSRPGTPALSLLGAPRRLSHPFWVSVYPFAR